MKYIAGIVLYNPDLGRLKENIESICKQVDKVILIDNGSDNIREIEDLIKEYLNCILLKNGENMGIAYDIAIQMDGDGQHDPKYLDTLIAPIVSGTADVVIGSRFLKKEGFQSSRSRRIGIRILGMLVSICCIQQIKDVTSGFRAVNKEFMQVFAKDYPQDYPEPESIVAVAMHKGKIAEVPVKMCERHGGESSISFGKSVYYMIKVSLAILICRISFGVRRKK